MFLHMPNWNEVSRDIVSIGDGFAGISHLNGIACEWAASVQHLALLYVQQDQIVTIDPYTGNKSQKKLNFPELQWVGQATGVN